MPDVRQLPNLLRLVDDSSETVRRAVLGELADFGDQLELALRALDTPPDNDQIAELLRTVAHHRNGGPEPETQTGTQDHAGAGDQDQIQIQADAPSEASPASAQTGPAPAGSSGLQRPAAGAPRYEEGQLVRHRRYGYRGVIVALDRRCKASADWYSTNRTQPGRDQAWYHVLVHGSHQVTYAAQTSLLPDESMAAIQHPLVPLFFDALEEGRYHRNRRRWPLDEV